MMKPKLHTVLKVIAALAGAWLMIALIRSAGWSDISVAFRKHYYALAGMTGAYLTYHLLRTYTLQICTLHPVRFTKLFGIRLAGEAIAYLAIGSIIGDTLKVALSRKAVPVVSSATGVFAEKLIYHLAGAFFILCGLCIALARFGASFILLYATIAMLAVFAALMFILSSGRRPVARLLRNVRVRKPKLREAIVQTEEQLFQFRKNHPKEFLLAFLINVLTYFYTTLEISFILFLLGFTPSFTDIWYYEAVVKLANSANVIVPGNLGVFEATNSLLARQLEFGEPTGIIVALFVRSRAIIWSIIGFFWFLYLLTRR